MCCSPWGHKELDRTKSLNNGNTIIEVSLFRNYIRFYHWGRGGGTLGRCFRISFPGSSWSTFPRLCVLGRFTCVQLFASLWSVAARLLCPWDSPGKNTGLDCHALLHGIFYTQELNPGFLYCRQVFYCLNYQTLFIPPETIFIFYIKGYFNIIIFPRHLLAL